MAGHSKWANIKHKKAKEDAKRGKLFSKLSKKITVAAKNGGGDPNANPELRMLIQKAKEANMPNENIERAIKKGTGELEGVTYEHFTYEGYGPGGIALYIELMSDNRNRTAAEIRHLLSKNGGNLGESGCVAWMFERKGQIVIDGSEKAFDEDELMMAALEAGAEDVEVEDKLATIYTAPGDLMDVRENLVNAGYIISDAEVAMIPKNTVEINDPDVARKVLKLMDILEDHDDVQEVYSNFDIPEEIMRELTE
ncbi:transcriptional regulator [Anoxybacter fermentans]|uniref:Probable transcriptional regulatory protein BBF96_06780 n=1 Tax=Anoxybacter fermentans TaxID=1323375 RepID=A0A3S9SY05_9FIRM|nr:YebC/PmpR family DNA-binding transcriptional regulator [Anoxybacter fermentans]AZR73114.1 transcriptional regulator [Anoxybacter fermentans]